jgi:hypothetical protein
MTAAAARRGPGKISEKTDEKGLAHRGTLWHKARLAADRFHRLVTRKK